MEKTNETLKKELERCNEQNELLSIHIERLNKDQKARNIIFYKLEDSLEFNKFLYNEIVELLKTIDASFNSDYIEDVRRLGRKPGNRPVRVRFTSKKIKMNIFGKIINAKNSNFSIDNDLTDSELAYKNNLREIVDKLRNRSIQANIKSNKILVGSTTYNIEEIGKKFRNILLPIPAEDDLEPLGALN